MQVVSADWVVPVEGEPIRDGAVAIEDGLIAAVGPASDLGAGERFPDAVILPGFVNAHSHLEYAVYAGFGDGQPFGPWLATHIERKGRLADGDAVAIARLGAAECLTGGVTTVADASHAGAAAVACAELGLRAIVAIEVFKSDPAAALARIDRIRARIAHALSDRVQLGVSPHSPYTTSPEVYSACVALGLPVLTHFAESEHETSWLTRGEGPLAGLVSQPPAGTTGIRLLARHGVLGPSIIAAHCVQVDDEEIELLAAHDVAVAHCPRSNGYLGCGVAPLAELLEAGVRVGLGTDSPASTPSIDMFDEMRAALVASRARAGTPEALAATTVLELATLGSARALGLDAEVGSLEAGKHADLCVLSLEGSPFLPVEDPVTAVVLGGSPDRVAATLVGGEERYRKGLTEWRDLADAARNARSRMLR